MSTTLPDVTRRHNLHTPLLRAVRLGVAALACLFAGADAATANTCRWVGLGADNAWSTPLNWADCGGTHPQNGDNISFLKGAPQPRNVNDLGGLQIGTVTITGAGQALSNWAISGAGVTVTTGMLFFALEPSFNGTNPGFNVPITLGQSLTIANRPDPALPFPGGAGIGLGTINLNGFLLTVETQFPIGIPALAGNGGLRKTGAVQLLMGESTYTGSTEVREGTLVALSTHSFGAPGRATDFTDVSAGGTLFLEENVSLDEAVKLSGGTIATRAGTVATLLGPLFQSAGTLAPEGTLTIAGPVDTGVSGALIQRGGGTLILSNRANAWSSLDVIEGTLRVGAPGAIPSAATLILSEGPQVATLDLNNFDVTLASLQGGPLARVLLGSRTLTTGSGRSATFAGTIIGTRAPAGLPPEAYFRLIKVGVSTFVLTGTSDLGDQAVVDDGVFQVDGRLSGSGVLLRNGTVSGSGTIAGTSGVVSNLIMRGGQITPGSGRDTIGILHGDAAAFSGGGLFVVQIAGPVAGTGYDQLDLTNNLTLDGTARLIVRRTFAAPQGSRFTVVNLAPGRVVSGIFLDLPEGGTLTASGQRFRITYHGGDGNDVVLTALDPPPAALTADAPAAALTYYLSEGVTGPFFDEDVLIANPNAASAPVTLTFTKETGEQIVTTRTLPPQSHLTVSVDQIPGLEQTAASAQVRSDSGAPLVVERSMFWDATHYAGHTGSAVDQPGRDWFFAEGSQGLADTFVLVVNPNATPTDVTFTFFRENADPVVKTITVGAMARFTLHAGAVPELVNRSFGIAAHATQPIMAERSMYFGSTPTRLWSGGTESAGVTAPSTQWFLAEGATGPFFDTFLLLCNPQRTAAHVRLQYLLDTGETVTAAKTIPANGRLTVNVNAEQDSRLHDAAVSTVVSADVPILAERSMYWPGAAAATWTEGHNSFGVVEAGTKWGLSEGRSGGPQNFHTYIVLGNPQKTAANVKITYLRDTGAPIVQTVTVPATSRLNVDTTGVDGLDGASFGALVEVTNHVPIVVERSMYWDANGVTFSGGTNATGIRLP